MIAVLVVCTIVFISFFICNIESGVGTFVGISIELVERCITDIK